MEGREVSKQGKLNLVDPSGSERLFFGNNSKRCSTQILSQVIGALLQTKVNKNIHLPFRQSKLTRYLADSLGGNCKTCIIATIGPADYNYQETLRTVRFAAMAKNVKNYPRVNLNLKYSAIEEYKQALENAMKKIDVQLPF